MPELLQSFSDNAPTTGVMELYKVPENLFDKDKIHFSDNYMIVRKQVRINTACHGIARILSDSNRIKRRNNLVLDQGRELIADIMAGRLPADPITKFSIGTGGYIGTPDPNVNPPKPLGTDIQLNAEIFEKDIDSIEKPNRAANTYIGFLASDEQNGVLISEWALKTFSGLTFSRVTTKQVPKESGFVYVIRWTIQH